MKKDYYIFPAIFDYSDDGISIEFPDLEGCLPCASTTEEAIKNSREALGLHIYGMEQDNEIIPEPTPINKIKTEENQTLILVEVFMPVIRESENNKAVKKTLTIPKWLDALALKNKVNFSQILQTGLKQFLNIEKPQKDKNRLIELDLFEVIQILAKNYTIKAVRETEYGTCEIKWTPRRKFLHGINEQINMVFVSETGEQITDFLTDLMIKEHNKDVWRIENK